MTSKVQESSSCDLCNVELSSIQEQLEHDFSLIHHMKLHQKHKKLVHLCSLCSCEVGSIKAYVSHLHGSKHQKHLKSRKEEWLKNPPTSENLKYRFHVSFTNKHQNKFKNASSNKSSRNNFWETNSSGPQNFEKNSNNKFDNPSKKKQYRGANNYNYPSFSGRNPNSFANAAPFRFNEIWYNNNPKRMQNNQNWSNSFQPRFSNNYDTFIGAWGQHPFTENSYNSWNCNPQHNAWQEANFTWNSNYIAPEGSTAFSEHTVSNSNVISEPDKAGFPGSTEETVSSTASNLEKTSFTEKMPKESNDKSATKKRGSEKPVPKLKKANNKKLPSPPVLSEYTEQSEPRDNANSSIEKGSQGKMDTSEKSLGTKKNDSSDQMTLDSQLNKKINARKKVKTGSPRSKCNNSTDKRKTDGKHMYFLSSDSDSDDQRSGVHSDSSESAADGSTKEKFKDESYNKAILNRLINFPCTRKQQVQLAKWMQEHSKLKKKLLFPRFNLQLVPPDSEKNEEMELRRVLSEMMTELPGEAIDALVDVFKQDSTPLPQEGSPEMADEDNLFASDSDMQDQFSFKDDVQVSNSQGCEKSSPKDADLANITIKPDPDGPESFTNNSNEAHDTSHEKSNFVHPSSTFITPVQNSSENSRGGFSFRFSPSPDNCRSILRSPASAPVSQQPSPSNTPVQPVTNMPSEVHALNSKLSDISPGVGPNSSCPEQATQEAIQRKNQTPTGSHGFASTSRTFTFQQPDLNSDDPVSCNVEQNRPSSFPSMQDKSPTESVDHHHKNSPVLPGTNPNLETYTEVKRPESSHNVFEAVGQASEQLENSSSEDPLNQQKWTEMPSWFKKPSADFFQNECSNVAAGPSSESSTAAHSLVDKLLALSKEEEMIREQSKKVDQVVGQMHKVLEEWKQKKSELQQEEIDLRKRRVSLLEMLQGSLSTDTNVGNTSPSTKMESSGLKDNEPSVGPEPSDKNQNVTYLGTLDSTWDIIQQLGLNLPSTSDSGLFDSSEPAKKQKGGQKKKSGKMAEAGDGKVKGKRTSKSSSSTRCKKQKLNDPEDPSSTKGERKKTKRKRNSAAEQAIVLQDLLNHFVKRDTKSSKSRSKVVHERPADSTSEDVPNSTTQATPFVIKSEDRVVDTFGPVEAHGSAILDLKVSAGHLYTCSSDKTAKCIEIKNPSNCVLYSGHEKTVSSIQLVTLDDGTDQLFTTSHDGYLRCFDAKSGVLLKEQHAGSSILCLTRGFGNLYLGLNNGQVWPYRISTGKFLDVFDFSQTSISRIAAGREGGQRLLCIVTYDGTVSVRNAISGLLIRLLDIEAQPPCWLQIDGSEIFLTTSDRSIFVFDLTSGSMLKRILSISVATGLYVTRSHMLVCSFDGFIRCYNRKNWALHKVYYGAGKTMAMCLEVHDGWIFSGNRQGIVEAIKTDHTIDATCWFLDCKLPFGHWKDLKHHLLADHMARVYPDSVSTWKKCPWLNCQHILKGITGQEKLQELEDHILEHAESTQR